MKCEFRLLQIEDKETFDRFFKEFPPQISEFTFTNLFSWRLTKQYGFQEVDGHLVVSYVDEAGSRRFLQPVGPEPAKIIKQILTDYQECSFERVEKKIAEQLKNELNIAEDRAMFDYVYLVKDMQELKGDRFTPKRNFINRCLKYNPVVCPLDGETVNDFLKLQENWCNIRDCLKDKGLYAEDLAIREALKNFKELGFLGVCIRIKGNIEAFAIGEKLNNNTFVEHFEKANTNFEGIYQFVFNEFAKKIPIQFEFLNREQDLGIEGLRKAKQSYNPVKMIDKHRITKKI